MRNQNYLPSNDTCQTCERILRNAERTGRRPAGNWAKTNMGHTMVFTPTGRAAVHLDIAWKNRS